MSELDLNITPFGNFMGILQSFLCIRKKRLHLLFRLYIELPAGISHSVLIRHFFAGLKAQKDIMSFGIGLIGIMYIIGGNQRYAGFFMKTEDSCINLFLLGISVILKLQEKVVTPENLNIMKSRSLCLIIKIPGEIFRNLSRKAGRKCDDPFVEFFKGLKINSRLIVVTVCEATGHDLHEI